MWQLQECWCIYLWHLITKEIMRSKIIFFILISLAFASEASAQCAMCRAVLETQEDQSAAQGINDGIVYLMVFPYLLMAGVAYFIWKSRRKRRAEEQ